MMKRHHFSPFKFYINREKRLVIVLNPKVGTKSVRHALNQGFKEAFGMEDPSNGRYRLFKKAREFPFAPLRDYWHALSNTEDYEFYCFVRNPYARLRSAWLNKLAYGHDVGYSKSVRKKILKPVRKFARQNGCEGGTDHSAIPFSTLVSFVESETTGERDHHWDEQHSVLFMDAIHYTGIYKLETQFNEGMTHILKRIGIDDDCIGGLLGIHRNKSAPPSDTSFDTDLARRAHSIYARDFETLGYEEDSWKGL